MVDPANSDLADDAPARLCARLGRAGLLAAPPAASIPRPDPRAVAEAGKRPAKGRSVAELLVADRE